MAETIAVSVRSIGSKPFDVEVAADVQVADLRFLISQRLCFPAERLKLVLKGQPLLDSQGPAGLQQGDSLLAILAPRAPPKHVQQRHDAETADADGGPDDPARFSLPANASPAKRRLVAFLRQRLRLPDVALVILFGVRPWVWAAFLAWIIGAPIAHRLEMGALYVLGTLLALILMNLGTRKPGEASAYSVFNNFRELPGQLNANRLDDQIRHGQM